jgi:hypothetical protein
MACGIKKKKKETKAEVHKKKAKDIKREQSIRPFKTEKNDKDEKVLTCMTYRQRRIVDRSPGLQEKSKKT